LRKVRSEGLVIGACSLYVLHIRIHSGRRVQWLDGRREPFRVVFRVTLGTSRASIWGQLLKSGD
jgi:hypothetical protein